MHLSMWLAVCVLGPRTPLLGLLQFVFGSGEIAEAQFSAGYGMHLGS